jgi:hypothetical protein
MEHMLFQVLDDIFSRPVFPHQPRLVLSHLARDFVRDRVDRGIHVVGLFAGFDRDVVRADQDDFGGVAVFFHFENDVRFNDLRVIEVEALDLAGAIIVDRVGHLQMPAGDFDVRVSVSGYHFGSFRYI